MAEELVYPVYNLLTNTQQNPPIIVFVLQEGFNARPLQNFEGVIQAEFQATQGEDKAGVHAGLGVGRRMRFVHRDNECLLSPKRERGILP